MEAPPHNFSTVNFNQTEALTSLSELLSILCRTCFNLRQGFPKQKLTRPFRAEIYSLDTVFGITANIIQRKHLLLRAIKWSFHAKDEHSSALCCVCRENNSAAAPERTGVCPRRKAQEAESHNCALMAESVEFFSKCAKYVSGCEENAPTYNASLISQEPQRN